jgi:dCTP deaminase
MILSDKTIEQFIVNGHIEVSPSITEEQVQPASLDVRFGHELYDVHEDRHLEDDSHVLEPGRAYIGHTRDYISLPNEIAAQLTGRSSVGRKGVIIHKTAGWIDPCFEGQITLELYNFSSEPVSFDVGDRIGQLVFFMIDKKSSGYDGQYQGQTGITR